MLGRASSVQVPACAPFGRRIRLQRIGGTLVVLAVALLFLFLVWPRLENPCPPRELRKWVAMV